jgi:uncharacterized protein (DUF2235 family)
MFGFSRGAFAVRRLAGVINTTGIVSRRFVNKAWEGFKIYHDKPGDKATQEEMLDHAAKALEFRQSYGKGGRNPDGSRFTIDTPPPIEYLGVFDTVMQRGMGQVLDAMFPALGARYRFKNLHVCPNVVSARHAMAIDEHRRGFPPTPWEGLDEANQKARSINGDLGYDPFQQRWFVGMHGDVGGGDGSPLAAATLKWITDGAAKRGLRFYGKHGEDASPMEAEMERAGPELHRAPIGRPKFVDGLVKPQNWPGRARRIWSDRHKRPAPDDLVLYFDDTVLRRYGDKDMRPRYKPDALKPFRDAIKEKVK